MSLEFNIAEKARKNVLGMKPYSSARDEFKGTADVYLDANENPYPSPFNRYPDPLQLQVKQSLTQNTTLTPSNIFLGNGSDEAIDLLIRAFCEPKEDSILITGPTYGMYKVCAEVNDVKVIEVSLSTSFELELDSVFNAIDKTTKIIFLCSPNNPSGNLLDQNKIEHLLQQFNGLVVIDEAYIDFAQVPSFTHKLKNHPNLVVLQTFSKAWGLAGIRLGMCFASSELVGILNKIKHPYNISQQTQEFAIKALQKQSQKEAWVSELIQQRTFVEEQLRKVRRVERIFPSHANFILIKIEGASNVYKQLIHRGIIVRDRSNIHLCDNCLRITIGTANENKILLKALSEL
jgi:histidinol-phosphate aminotransferase